MNKIEHDNNGIRLELTGLYPSYCKNIKYEVFRYCLME